MPEWFWVLMGAWAVGWAWAAWRWRARARDYEVACADLRDMLLEILENRCPFAYGKLPEKLPELHPFQAKVVCRGEKVKVGGTD